MHIAAMVAAQNGITLASCFVTLPPMLPASLLISVASVILPLPLAAGLLLPTIVSSPNCFAEGLAALRRLILAHASTWLGWIDIGLTLAMFAATLIVPLDSLASIFAPLLGLDAVLRSYVRLHRRSLTPVRRTAALLQSGFTILTVCAPNPIVAWLAVLAATAMAILPTMSRRWTSAVLAFLAAGLSLFGMILLQATPSTLGYFSLLVGFATIAATIPDLAIALVIMLLRLATQAPWPPAAEALGIGISVIALLTCTFLLTTPVRTHRLTLVVLAQASIAALAICIGEPDSRFAALVLLILLVLSRAAARITVGPVATVAMAGLGGIPPLGLFPGLVLIVLTICAHASWLLLPLGAALVPIVLASVPDHLPDFSPSQKLLSLGWLPLLLAVAAGFFAPNSLVHWWRVLAAGRT